MVASAIPTLVLSEAERRVMRHALGLSHKVQPYRNYFYTVPTHPDGALWEALVVRGLARRHPGTSTMAYYQCTHAGAELALGHPVSRARFHTW